MSHYQPAAMPAQRLLPPAVNWAYRPVADICCLDLRTTKVPFAQPTAS